ncbi:MAG: hypothetical protein Q9219_001690 [cf. Caloplaca sp. 3 TL-2023]
MADRMAGEEPSAKVFVRRHYHASIVLGDYVYIDSGEVSVIEDGEPSRKLNSNTVTIDISRSWTNDSAPFGVIDKHGFVDLDSGFLFPSTDDKSIFQFGGETSRVWDAWLSPETAISQLTLSGRGNGSWSGFNPGSNSGFERLTRPGRALAATLDDTFFITGGVVNSHTSQASMNVENGENIALEGIVAYNMTTGKWTNSSTPGHLTRPDGTNGILESVHGYGPAGLLVAAGTGTVDGLPPDFKNITIYEPKDQTWHYQTSTGDIPPGRDTACTVGVQGDNGTYEINTKVTKDPATHGLQIFDMTEMRWSDSYDANAVSYTTPQVVKDWYAENDMSPTHFDDPAVRDFFARSLPATTDNPTDTATTSSSSTVQSSSSNSQSNTGAIAGGVVGGIAAACLVTALVIYFLRRRRKHKLRTAYTQELKPEMADTGQALELHPDSKRVEIGDKEGWRWEAGGTPRVELDGRGD